MPGRRASGVAARSSSSTYSSSRSKHSSQPISGTGRTEQPSKASSRSGSFAPSFSYSRRRRAPHAASLACVMKSLVERAAGASQALSEQSIGTSFRASATNTSRGGRERLAHRALQRSQQLRRLEPPACADAPGSAKLGPGLGLEDDLAVLPGTPPHPHARLEQANLYAQVVKRLAPRSRRAWPAPQRSRRPRPAGEVACSLASHVNEGPRAAGRLVEPPAGAARERGRRLPGGLRPQRRYPLL